MSDQNWRPGQPYPISVTEINPYQIPTYSNNTEGGGYDRTGRTRNRSRTGSDLFSTLSKQDIHDINEAIAISNSILAIEAIKPQILNEHQIKLNQLPYTLQAEIDTATNNFGGTQNLTSIEILGRQQTAVNHLIHQKTSDRSIHQAKANAFYGVDPLIRNQQDFIEAYLQWPAGEVLQRWADSYSAAHSVQLATEEMIQLTNRSHVLAAQINQAEAEAQLQARQQAEAERAAQARAAAEEIRQLEIARQAEQQRKQQIAAQAANRFEAVLQYLTLNPPEDINEKLRWLKEKYQELHAADLESSEAERNAGLLDLKGNERRSSLKKVKQDIDALVRVRHGIENVNISTVSGAEASARPLIVTPDGLIAGYEGSPFSLNRAIESLGNLRAAALGGPVSAFFSSVLYTPTLGNSELQRNPVVVTIPLSQLVDSDTYPDLQNADTTDLLPLRVVASVRGDHTQLYLSPTDEKSSSVRVRQAILDSNTNLYTFTTEGSLPRTLTWTPNSAPGGDTLGSTDLPASSPDIKIYPGARVTQVEGRSDEHPMCDETDTDDYILVFPAESGIKPVYVMASRSGPRYEPGTASGVGQAVGNNWLGSAREVGGSPIPAQIANQLRGQNFRSFDKFREKIWRLVAADTSLREQFGKADLKLMLGGAAPTVDEVDFAGKKDKFEIHHKNLIKNGGAVYDIDNLTIMTPKAHIELHRNGKKP